jgi:hypothetical protein
VKYPQLVVMSTSYQDSINRSTEVILTSSDKVLLRNTTRLQAKFRSIQNALTSNVESKGENAGVTILESDQQR